MDPEKILFTSESVSEGHVDKLCDQIADAILDACLSQDPQARVACEVFICNQTVIIGGEITSKATVNYEQIARKVLERVGYDNAQTGIDYRTCAIEVLIHEQSPELNQGGFVNNNVLAGDQGIMFGYATNESSNYMPLAIKLAHELVKTATNLRHLNQLPGALPDMKAQVTLDLSIPEQPRLHTIIMSVQHQSTIDPTIFRKLLIEKVIKQVVKDHQLNHDFKIIINPLGPFLIGGPLADTGLTGRKIIVDTYGGAARHGGGSFSGKDATKVDRLGAYLARYIAKNVVAANIAQRCEIQLAYAIGQAKPIAINVETFNTSKMEQSALKQLIDETFAFDLKTVINQFHLTEPIFEPLAVYGHVGRDDLDVEWEKLDKVPILVTKFKAWQKTKNSN